MFTQDTERAIHPASPLQPATSPHPATSPQPAAAPQAQPKAALPRASAKLGDEFAEPPLLRDRLPDDEGLGEHDLNLERLMRDDIDVHEELNVTLLNVPYRADKAGFDGAVLDAFFRGKRVEAAREYFYLVDGRPHFSCWIEWTEADAGSRSGSESGAESGSESIARNNRRKSDGSAGPVARLDEDPEFAVAMTETQRRAFDGLRAWRLGRARDLGLPAYRVLTNRVMERIARANPVTVDQLATIPGVGPATVETHGHAIVAVTTRCAASSVANATRESVDPVRSPLHPDLRQPESTLPESRPPESTLPESTLPDSRPPESKQGGT